MSGRCKICDRKMSDNEMTKKYFNPITQQVEYNEYCSTCSYKETPLQQIKNLEHYQD